MLDFRSEAVRLLRRIAATAVGLIACVGFIPFALMLGALRGIPSERRRTTRPAPRVDPELAETNVQAPIKSERSDYWAEVVASFHL